MKHLEKNFLQGKIKLLSLDIFDTLLFRTCSSPSDVFLEVANRANKEKLFERPTTPGEFKNVRIIAEKKARANNKKGGIQEVTLDEIYDEMPVFLGDLERVKEIELNVECDFCYLNPSVYSLVKFASQKNIAIALVSNMYLGVDAITEILNSVGFSLNMVDTILVSSEYGVQKNNGDLFRILLDRYPNIPPSEIFHVGDNFQADILSAQEIGINAVHYQIINRDFNSITEWEYIRHGEILPELFSLRRLLAGVLNKKDDFWFSLGGQILGPFLVIFCEWVIQIAVQEGRKEIFPLMREGSLLTKILNRIIEKRGLDIQVSPLYVSRQATFLASKETINKDILHSFFERRNFTVKDLFQALEIDHHLSTFEQYADNFLSEAHSILCEKNRILKDELIDYLLRDDCQKEINKVIKNNRDILISYLKQCTPFVDQMITVDIGFEGTIQTALESLLRLKDIKSNLIHLLAFGGEKNKHHLANGIDIRGFAGNSGENYDLIQEIIRCSEIIEQLMMESEGSVIGYKMNDKNDVEPILGINGGLNSTVKNAVHKGIFMFQEMWFYLTEQKPWILNRLLSKKRDWVKLIHRLLDMPNYNEALHIGNLYFDENFGSKFVSKFVTNEDNKMLDNLGIEDFLKINSGGYRMNRVSWPQGVVTKKYPSYLFNHYLQNNKPNNYLAKMLNIIYRLKEYNYTEFIIYGAGEAGEALLQVAKLNNMTVNNIVDRKEALWGTYINGVEVVSLEHVIKYSDHHVFGIGSFSFAGEIKHDIIQRYKNENIEPVIFTVFD